ncbi:hypothetical protein COY93_01455 [Candidatus Uhrbacteria bacterium CG_4_10_14_0_8_um_filter_58_22]|uniref:Uncharacterized protein n=1 Tax=Candidatus Uhrbacteria bacterium CG_4_10_14_0_8_um_filter_58_22 TaxID=1975029 RepID=A0A2M7QAK4_9BACT|nr:MAG: hypothetical protein AUJ19_01770 [Parcubacteria group bacterium CG1_02_58_44]PIY63069.1 MAG: hypothetical protein COY93_01455 [Candidatus Uhrbacteria bacterium CG_4_10_14_0_8_um_filter_58_22]
MDIQDKILNAVLETQSDIQELKGRVEHIEDVNAKTYDKLDGFLTLIDRHESEIAALRAKFERLEERIGKLEASRA